MASAVTACNAFRYVARSLSEFGWNNLTCLGHFVPEQQRVEDLFVLDDAGRLQVAFWGVPLLLSGAQSALKNSLKKWKANGDSASVKEEVDSSSRICLMIHADNGTALNARREISQHHLERSLLEEERRFLNFIFTRHPKCGQSWAYRQWLVAKLLQSAEPSAELDAILKSERQATIDAVIAYPKNYYAWSYRAWILQHISTLDAADLLLDELDSIRSFCSRNWSDNSALHFKSLVMEAIRDRRDVDPNVIVDMSRREWINNTSDILQCPGREGLWNFRRKLVSEYGSFECANANEVIIPEFKDEDEFDEWYQMKMENTFVSDLGLVDFCWKHTEIYEYEQQARSAVKHCLWLLYVVSQSPRTESGDAAANTLVSVLENVLSEESTCDMFTKGDLARFEQFRSNKSL